MTRAEPGCLQHVVHRIPSGGFFIYEVFIGRSAWKADLSCEHFMLATSEILPMLESSDRLELEPLDYVQNT